MRNRMDPPRLTLLQFVRPKATLTCPGRGEFNFLTFILSILYILFPNPRACFPVC